jgi:YbbR domain-containing protein
MQSLTQFLTRNWLAKLFSLALATMLWITIASETSSEVGVTVPLQYQNIPPQLEINEQATNTVEVRVRGSANLIKELSPQEVSVSLDLAGISSGEKELQLTTQNIEVPFGIEVVRVNPSRVRLSLERTMSRVVPVTATVEGRPAAGFEVKDVSVFPNAVEVQGPENKVRELESVSTVPVIIEGAGADVQKLVDLDLPDSLIRLKHHSTVDVRVRIEEGPRTDR